MKRASRIVLAAGIAGMAVAISVSGGAAVAKGTVKATGSTPPIWFCSPGEGANPTTSGYCHGGTAQGTADCAADAILAGAGNLTTSSKNLEFTFTASVSGALYFALAFRDVRTSTRALASSFFESGERDDTECSGGEEPSGGPLPSGTVEETASSYNWPQSSFDFGGGYTIAVVADGERPITAGQKVQITTPINSTGQAILAYAHAHHLPLPAISATLVVESPSGQIGAALEATTLHP
jgi:hypothetical protein